jgi:hypothetical protein
LRHVLVLDAFIGTLLRLTVIILGIAAFLILPNSNPNFTLLELANHLLPTGAKGLAVVGLLAIMMSTIDSTIHLGAVALTQDIFPSKQTINEEKKLKYARYSSLVVIAGAIITSLNFDKIGNLFYLLMALGNCLLWPGIFLGLSRLSSSKKGFWLGAITGFTTLLLCLSIFDIDLLYVNLIATSASLLAHACYALRTEKTAINFHPFFALSKTKICQGKIFKKIRSTRVIKNKDYCNIFCVLSIILSVYPFFIVNNQLDFQKTSYIFPMFSLAIGFLAVAILFADFWFQSFIRFYSTIWGLLVALALPAQTYFMVINADTSFVWVMDAILIIPLVTTLTTKSASFLLHILGIIIALTVTTIIDFSSIHLPLDFGYWAILMHTIVLMLCFALLRKRDVELCRFEASTIAHETKRVLNTFESMANFYDHRLPVLIDCHNSTTINGTTRLTTKELDMLLSLPTKTQVLADRTRKLLTSCIDRIASYSKERIFTKQCSIRDCIVAATSDASLSEHVKNIIELNLQSDINVKGDQEQLIQVFINLLENAGHAIISTPLPRIRITIMGNTVFITDNGCGISSTHLPSIFDEFFSTKSSNGQGLAFSKSVMIEHGGSILCTSKENSFTQFELRFPPTF